MDRLIHCKIRLVQIPPPGIGLHYSRGLLDLALGRNEEALADFQVGERLAPTLVTPNILATPMRAHMLQTLLRPGQTERVEAALAGLDEHERGDPEMRATLVSLRLAQHDPQAATAALAPVIDGSVGCQPFSVVAALLLEAMARDALRDPAAAGRALERALDLAWPNSVLMAFLIHPAPELLERHARQRTASRP
jgi:LuxR family maltose regulon positive regulatory protein